MMGALAETQNEEVLIDYIWILAINQIKVAKVEFDLAKSEVKSLV